MQVLVPADVPLGFAGSGPDDGHLHTEDQDGDAQAQAPVDGVQAREEALLQCFQRLDLDASGYIDISELRALAKQITPKVNLEDALDMLQYGDRNKDQKLSWEEFRDILLPLSEPMSDEEFTQHIHAMLSNRPYHALNEPGYQHPQGSREWLEASVVPKLREGLHALVNQLMTDRLALAAGSAWEEGPRPGEGGQQGTLYLPHGWKPFQPLRWLGEWLLDQLPPSTPTSPKRGRALASFCAMSRRDKIALAFAHLDRDGSGCLDASELLSVAGKLHKDKDLAHAQELLQSMDLNDDGRVDLHEYSHFVTSLTEVLTDSEFDAAIHKVLDASHYSYCNSRHDKLSFLFHDLDPARSGNMSYEEVVQLAHRLDPTATPWKIQATLDGMGLSGRTVSVQDFVSALTKLLSHLTTDELDSAIIGVVDKRKLGSVSHAVNPLDEVEPIKYRQYLEEQPRTEHVLEIGTMDVIDWVDGASVSSAPLLLVDVRSHEEVSVSTLPGALHLPVQEDSSEPLGWALGDLEPLRRRLAETLTQGSRVPWIVAYCNTGQRSGPASVLLGKTLGVAVRCLCGGLISYYNAGGRVKDRTGSEVQAIHPGSPDLKPFVTRPSAFKFQSC